MPILKVLLRKRIDAEIQNLRQDRRQGESGQAKLAKMPGAARSSVSSRRPRSCRFLSAKKMASVMPESISFAVIFTISASFPVTLPLPLGEKARC
jgi:hypothetical protein